MTNAFLLSRSAGENLATFLRLRGRHVYRAGGVFWTEFDIGSRMLMSFPDQAIPTHSSDIADLLSAENALAARYPCAEGQGVPGGLYLYRKPVYSLSDVQRQMRKAVRRGLECCQIRSLSADELLKQGLELNLDTMRRQRRFSPEFGDAFHWHRFVTAVMDCPFVHATGAFIDGQLAAYIIGCRDANWMHLLYQYSRQAMMPQRPNHALAYCALAQALEDPAVQVVSCGPRPLELDEGLHAFKTRLGYEDEPMEVAVQFHPWLAPLLASRAAAAVATSAARRWPGRAAFVKAAHVLDAACHSRRAAAPAVACNPLKFHSRTRA
jgi:hypothetical protein